MFTNKTYSILRESVRRSMATDRKNGLPTGEPVFVEIYQPIGIHMLYETFPSLRQAPLNCIMVHQELTVSYFDTKRKRDVKNQKLGKFLRAYSEASDECIKQYVTKMAPQKAWIMFTSTHIDKHYRVIGQEMKLESCMSYKPSKFERLRPNHRRYNGQARYIHPTEAYEGNDTLRLALATRFKPGSDEYNNGYPFIGRAICGINDQGDIEYTRSYGDEKSKRIYRKGLKEVKHLDGHFIKKIFDSYDEPVVPYIDYDNRLEDYDYDFYRIDGKATVEPLYHNGQIQESCRFLCDHCDDYHRASEAGHAISNSRDEQIYGECKVHYRQPRDHNSYYHIDDLVWSDHHTEYLIEDEAIAVVSNVHADGAIDTDWVLINEAHCHHDIEKLEDTHTDYDYAFRGECTETENGWYLEYELTEFCRYCQWNELWYDIDEHDWVKIKDGYVLECDHHEYLTWTLKNEHIA